METRGNTEALSAFGSDEPLEEKMGGHLEGARGQPLWGGGVLFSGSVCHVGSLLGEWPFLW